MNEHANMDTFEQRLSAEFGRMVAGATDSKPASEIADLAMRPRGMTARLKASRSGRRLLLLGLAAAFMVPAAYVGALRIAPRQTDSTLPKPSQLAVAPTLLPSLAPTTEPADAYEQIAVARVEGGMPGVQVSAIRSDGYERALRFVPDSVLQPGHKLADWGSASTDGWLALADTTVNWPMVLVDLKDPQSEPWVVDDANLGGITPAWGPDGLVAADSANTQPPQGVGSVLVIVDPVARTVREIQISGGLIGGGPSIIWTADGGILESFGGGVYKTHHLDGSADTAGFPKLYDGRQIFGPNGGTLQLCDVGDNQCRLGASPGGVRLTTIDGVSQNVYTPGPGGDRVAAAAFGAHDGEYWVMTDADAGREFSVLHVIDDTATEIERFNRAADWGSAWINSVAPDGSLLTVMIDRGNRFSFVVAPTDGRPASLHLGSPVGFAATGSLAGAGTDSYAPPSASLPPAGESYQLPSVDELIANEKAMNPGRIVHGMGSREGDATDSAEHDYTFNVDQGGAPLDVYLDCYGPAPATVTVHGTLITSPCARSGSYIGSTYFSPGQAVTVHTSGATSWRVVVYGMGASSGGTPPPVPVS